MKFFRRNKRVFSVVSVITFLSQMFLPNIAFAITGHDSMPEYRSFEPVATTNMVNPFSGDFTYNIPLLDVPNGYPINLSYHSSEVNSEAQASWVGLGWTLNPGAVNRVKRGLPDEYDGVNPTNDALSNKTLLISKMPKNRTIEGQPELGVNSEIFGVEDMIQLSGNLTLRYNNYNGFSATPGLSLGVAGMLNSSVTYGQGQFGFHLSAQINPMRLFNTIKAAKQKRAYKEAHSKEEVTTKETEDYIVNNFGPWHTSNDLSFFGGVSMSSPTPYPTSYTPYNGAGGRFKVDAGVKFMGLPIEFLEQRVSLSYSEQENLEAMEIPSYGYLHNEKAWDDPYNNSIMDYETDNDHEFDKRDKVLGMPIPNYDMFSMSGEGMGGTFRAYRSEFGHYRKNSPAKSETYTGNAGIDLTFPVGLDMALKGGVNLGMDYHSTELGKWSDISQPDFENYTFKNNSATNYPLGEGNKENNIFRFNGDMGSSFDITTPYLSNDNPIRSDLQTVNALGFPVGFKANPVISGTGIPVGARQQTRNRRSSYIDYARGNDFMQTSNGIPYKAHTKKLHFLEIDPNTGDFSTTPTEYQREAGSSIGEFATYNENGSCYVYGLPIYAKDEVQMSYSLSGVTSVAGSDMIYNGSHNDKRAMGHANSAKYSTQHLLTEIISPDYVDRTQNGPTPDDFGSYTKINYGKVVYGGLDDNYSFRSPYTGWNFELGKLSRNDDDMGAVTYGRKEIYYVHSIVSKTHVAVFTLKKRDDGKGSNINASLSAGDLKDGNGQLMSGSITSGNQNLQYLEKIDLYAIEDCERLVDGLYVPRTASAQIPAPNPIKTVHFEYDYDLCKNLPNNTSGNGKLTLKKLWFTYGGKVKSKLSPYQFSYEYPTNANYPSKYDGISNEMSAYSLLSQNPDYMPDNTDRWGNFRNYADTKNHFHDLARFYPYNDQNPSNNFDPAAYMLKKIELPSGGEIHIQYEEKDYTYVQDKRAMVMMPLKSIINPSTGIEDESKEKKYYLNIEALGINPTLVNDMGALADELFEPIKKEQQRIYFNFLYSLVGENANPDATSQNSEFIDGYARIDGYGWDNTNGIYFMFKNDGSGTGNYQQINYGNNVNPREIPRKACIDFYNSQRRGMLNGQGNALDNANTVNDAKSGILAAIANLSSILVPNGLLCKKMDTDMSYIRVQMPLQRAITNEKMYYGKKGGGARVKRLLMYEDGGATQTKPVLYGSEYDYTTQLEGKTISSGVATNEPQMGGKENVLKQPFERNAEAKKISILCGRDTYGNEGPLGESLYPGPSIGYSKITIRNIHSGRTGTGYTVNEYYTCKEFPVQVKYTDMDMAGNLWFGPNSGVNMGINLGPVGFSYSRDVPYLSQGFSVILNSMHGQIKRVAAYAEDASVNDIPLSEEVYEYFKPGEAVYVMDENFNKSLAVLGKESEILGEVRHIHETSVGGQAGLDFTSGVFMVGVFPLPIFTPTAVNFSAYLSENGLNTHVINRIISYATTIKKVTKRTDNIQHVTENLIFDKYTGTPVYTRDFDDFNGSYFTQDIKASWFYKNLRSKSINDNLAFTLPSNSNQLYSTNNSTYIQFNSINCGLLSKFVSGDLVELNPGSSSNHYLYHILNIDPFLNRLYLTKSNLADASFSNGTVTNIEIIHSGYTNQLGLSAGNYVIHDEASKQLYQGIANLPNGIWDDTQPLVAQMNNMLTTVANNIASGNNTGTVPLTGSFEHVSMDLDPCKIESGCQNEGVTVSGLSLGYNYNASNGMLAFNVAGGTASGSLNGSAVSTSINCGNQGPSGEEPLGDILGMQRMALADYVSNPMTSFMRSEGLARMQNLPEQVGEPGSGYEVYLVPPADSTGGDSIPHGPHWGTSPYEPFPPYSPTPHWGTAPVNSGTSTTSNPTTNFTPPAPSVECTIEHFGYGADWTNTTDADWYFNVKNAGGLCCQDKLEDAVGMSLYAVGSGYNMNGINPKLGNGFGSNISSNQPVDYLIGGNHPEFHIQLSCNHENESKNTSWACVCPLDHNNYKFHFADDCNFSNKDGCNCNVRTPKFNLYKYNPSGLPLINGNIPQYWLNIAWAQSTTSTAQPPSYSFNTIANVDAYIANNGPGLYRLESWIPHRLDPSCQADNTGGYAGDDIHDPSGIWDDVERNLGTTAFICAHEPIKVDCETNIEVSNQNLPKPASKLIGDENYCFPVGASSMQLNVKFILPSGTQLSNYTGLTINVTGPTGVTAPLVAQNGNNALVTIYKPGDYHVILHGVYHLPGTGYTQNIDLDCIWKVPECSCKVNMSEVENDGNEADNEICLQASANGCIQPHTISLPYFTESELGQVCNPDDCSIVVDRAPFGTGNATTISLSNCQSGQANYTFTNPGIYQFYYSGYNPNHTPPSPINSSVLELKVKDCRPPLATFAVTNQTACPNRNADFTATPTCEVNISSYQWNFGDGSPIAYGASQHHTFKGCGPFTVTLTVNNPYGTYSTNQTIFANTEPCHPVCECSSTIPYNMILSNQGGKFWFNKLTGQIIFRVPSCDISIPFNCFAICENDNMDFISIDKVVSASAVTYSDIWPYNEYDYKREMIALNGNNTFYNNADVFEKGFAGKWRVKDQYAYRTELDENENNPLITDEFRKETKNFNKGRFKLKMFDWQFGYNADEWVLTSSTTQYSPNGQPVEDRDILNVYSSSRYAKGNTIMSAVAKNAPKGSVGFESCEYVYPNTQEMDVVFSGGTGSISRTDKEAHTGEFSLKVNNDNAFGIGFTPQEVASTISDQGMMVRSWCKVKSGTNPTIKAYFVPLGSGVAVTVTMKAIASSGEWKLYEAKWIPTGGGVSSAVILGMSCNSNQVYIDDIRFQPLKSEVSCYVYDKSNRLSAVFDDQHFAAIYQYNDEGLLVRKQKETTQGVKTISENLYNSNK